MKFFAALIAKLTGADSAPKTLDQARATFGEAKAALDKVAAMFAAAALDFDAMLTTGENALKDHLAIFQGKVDGAEAIATAANEKVRDAEAKQSEAVAKAADLTAEIAALQSVFAAVGFKPAAALDKDGKALTGDALSTAFKAAFDQHLSGRVQQQMAELGVPAAKLPAATSVDALTTLDDIQAAMSTEKDPVKLGQLAAKANKLEAELRAKPTGKN